MATSGLEDPQAELLTVTPLPSRASYVRRSSANHRQHAFSAAHACHRTGGIRSRTCNAPSIATTPRSCACTLGRGRRSAPHSAIGLRCSSRSTAPTSFCCHAGEHSVRPHPIQAPILKHEHTLLAIVTGSFALNRCSSEAASSGDPIRTSPVLFCTSTWVKWGTAASAIGQCFYHGDMSIRPGPSAEIAGGEGAVAIGRGSASAVTRRCQL